MSNLKPSSGKPTNPQIEKRKKIILVEDYSQRKHNLSRSIVIEPTRRDYTVQGSWETFLSYEDPAKDVMSAFLILRLNDPSVPDETSLICELRVYDNIMPLINQYDRKAQSQSLGIHLLQWAEKIAIEEHSSLQIATVSSEANKNFFRKLGYHIADGSYLFKSLELDDYISALEYSDGPDLKFDDNQCLIKNELNPDFDEDEWLKKFDDEYKLHKSF